jgi:hypothetical protein
MIVHFPIKMKALSNLTGRFMKPVSRAKPFFHTKCNLPGYTLQTKTGPLSAFTGEEDLPQRTPGLRKVRKDESTD